MMLFGKLDRRIRQRAAALLRIVDVLADGFQPGDKLFLRIVRVLPRDLAPVRFGAARERAKIFGDLCVLRLEVPVERHLVGAGGFRDRFDADGANAVAIKQLGRRGEDALARGQGAGFRFRDRFGHDRS
jgi:hypothetical protein